MDQLQLCKLFAELEGVVINHISESNGEETVITLFEVNGLILTRAYNPITDLALNCAARDKYEASVCYDRSLVIICKYEPEYSISKASFRAGLKSTQVEISRAVIECILKSEGKL